ncbi:MAG TPA: recombinase family protein [Cytophagaceae bacterium]|jgi:site-specific DNA recombinase|nr:recombinase family protein [Cytophagaceae bacterium]
MENVTTYGAQIGFPAMVVQEPIKYCLYARKSSEAEEKQALSIDSQIKEMLTIAERDKLNIVDMYRESHSAKDCGQRPVFNKMITDIREGKFNGILVWHPDRLSRNAGDLGAIVDLLDQIKLIEIRTHSQHFTNNPNEKFLLMILGSQAKLENDNKSINVKRGLKTKCEMGLWPSVAPTGYLNSKNRDQKGVVFIDPDRSSIIKEIFTKVAFQGMSGRKLYRWLIETHFVTRTGKPLTLSNIYTILNNHFYHGTFEYPKGSGRWFQGKHVPLISKDLFDDAQKQLHLQIKSHSKNKEFAFTKMLTCGACGSGITAQEKYKNLKDGSVAKYIYYGCTRARDINCKDGYIEEKVLITQLLELMDKIDLDKSGIKKKLETEIERHKKFHSGIMGKPEQEYQAKNADIRNYAKYLLNEGTMFEKRDLLGCLKSKIKLNNKIISLIN